MQIALAALFLVVSLLVHAHHGSAPLTLLLDAALYLAVIVAARWGVVGAFTLIPLTLCLFAVEPDAARLGEYALLLPLVGGASRGPIKGWLGYTVVALAVLTGLVALRAGPRHIPMGVILWMLAFGVAWIVAATFRLLAEKAQLVRDKALTEQRLVVARDLHDTVAHTATEIVMRAERALLRDEADRADLRFIATAGRRAVDDIRATLVALNDVDRGAPGIDPLPTLSAVIRRAGQRLTDAGLVANIEDATDGVTVPVEVLTTVDAILREAVNNIIKHGDHTRPCGIMAENACGVLEITLVNARDAVSPDDCPDVPFGVLGMQSRADDVNGSLNSMASDDRWLTRLTVPLSTPQVEASR